MSGRAEIELFVLGAPRSGTTLLRRLLSRHPSLYVAPEHRVFELATRTAAALDLGGELPTSGEVSCSAEGLALGKLYVELLAARQLEAAGRRRYGDKYPPYGLQVPELEHLFPGARFVHLVRDGRDVASSALYTRARARGWRRSREVPTMEDLAGSWAAFVRGARAGLARIPAERVHELSYEDLTRRPVDTIRAVLAFLGEPTDAEVDAGCAEVRPGRSWRETLTTAELRRFDAVEEARSLLAALGYPPTGADGAAVPGGSDTEASWVRAAEEARATGDPAAARFAALRALWAGGADPRGALALLAQEERAESCFAAMFARDADDAASRAAMERWTRTRGLDAGAARAMFGGGAR